MTMHDDNIQVFEYPTTALAAENISVLSEYYYPKVKVPDSWKKDVHLYNKGQLVIFYMGTNKKIISELNSYAGISSLNQVALNSKADQ